jgi:large subunit ribosomal protein L21
MFAVVKTGGKQYRVAKDDVIRVEKLDAEAGDTVLLNEVLMISDENGAQTGTPMLPGAVVEAEVVEQTRNKKIIIFKKKRRQNYRRKRGHRQHVTVLKVIDIALDGSNKKATTKAKVAAAPAGDAPEKKATAKKATAKTAAKKTATKTTAKKATAKKAAAKKSDAE